MPSSDESAISSELAELDVRLLPSGLRVLVEAVGLAAAFELVRVYGGTTIYIPRAEHLAADHPLTQLIGLAHARRLGELTCGDSYHIPKGCAALRRIRDQRIVHEHYVEGVSKRELARRYRLDERQIYTITTRTALIDPHQEDLFGAAP